MHRGRRRLAPSPDSQAGGKRTAGQAGCPPGQPLPSAGPGGRGPRHRDNGCRAAVTAGNRPLNAWLAPPPREGEGGGGAHRLPACPPAAILAGLRRFRRWEVNREGGREGRSDAGGTGRTAGRRRRWCWGRLRWREPMWPERRHQRGPSPG